MVGIEELTEMPWKMFPNPARNHVMIQSDALIQQVVIVDMTGREVKRINEVNKNNIQVSVSELSGGVYYVTVLNDSGRKTKTLIIN